MSYLLMVGYMRISFKYVGYVKWVILLFEARRGSFIFAGLQVFSISRVKSKQVLN